MLSEKTSLNMWLKLQEVSVRALRLQRVRGVAGLSRVTRQEVDGAATCSQALWWKTNEFMLINNQMS